MDRDDEDDVTILELTALPDREMAAGDVTPTQETDPGVLAALAAVDLAGAGGEWVLGFTRGAAAKQADMRRALIAELMSRGAPREAAQDLAEAVVRRANGKP